MKFVDIIDGLTVTRQTDELTGLSSIVVQDVGERATAGKRFTSNY
ncbi:DNA-directed RNA polymerase subunit beta' [Haemophilus influenzae]|uniref:DNA-directed RNA polymerase subunit beta n=1 Tax=Haemophilus influenzae TaxID=727 RepID=A0A2X1PWW0_HAEIF|nr:DNA-directed RNA polymerase subunit beta' [Haemophilus influenzae]